MINKLGLPSRRSEKKTRPASQKQDGLSSFKDDD